MCKHSLSTMPVFQSDETTPQWAREKNTLYRTNPLWYPISMFHRHTLASILASMVCFFLFGLVLLHPDGQPEYTFPVADSRPQWSAIPVKSVLLRSSPLHHAISRPVYCTVPLVAFASHTRTYMQGRATAATVGCHMTL